MQTVTEHLTSDFECHPIGTGAELARLNDQIRDLESIAGAIAFDLVRIHGFTKAERVAAERRDESATGTTSFAFHNQIVHRIRKAAEAGAMFRKAGR